VTARIDRAAVADELAELLRDIEQREGDLAEHNKAVREQLAELRAQAKERRDILLGRRGVQMPLTAAVLDEAGKVRDRKGQP
jgi:hypothetical protein